MPNCYPCTVGITYHDPEAIGVCSICNNLACAGHGGRLLGVPQFKCGTCITGICTISSGGQNPPRPPPPGGLPVNNPQPPDQPGGQGVRFTSSLDFEIQLPLLARVSARWRREIFRESLYESLRRLFALLLDDNGARDEFLTRARETLHEPVEVRAQEQMAQSDRLGLVFEERGGLDALTNTGIQNIIARVQQWFVDGLPDWMARIHEPVDQTVWIGERFGSGGAIDILLLADALGLNAYMWNLAPGQSPFEKLEVVVGVDTGTLVLSDLYAQSMPVVQGMA